MPHTPERVAQFAVASQSSTRLSSLSTQVDARFQLRDVDFVSRCSTGSYLTTGVETRTSVQCPPALLSMETDARVSRQFPPPLRRPPFARYNDAPRLS